MPFKVKMEWFFMTKLLLLYRKRVFKSHLQPTNPKEALETLYLCNLCLAFAIIQLAYKGKKGGGHMDGCSKSFVINPQKRKSQEVRVVLLLLA